MTKTMLKLSIPYRVCCVVLFISSAQNLKFYHHGTFECNNNEKLTCETVNRPVNSELYIDNLLSVSCQAGSCSVNPLTPNDYAIDHDYSAGIINVTILSVSDSIKNTVFRCEGDSTVSRIGPNINVSVTPSKIYIDVIRGKETTSIHATSDCASPSDNITFKWFKTKIKEENPEELIPETIYTQQYSQNNTFCDPQRHCNGTGQSTTITFHGFTDDKIAEYFVYCFAYLSDNLVAKERTDVTVLLPDNDVAGPKKTLTTGEIVAIVVGIIAFLALIVVIVVIFVFKKKKKSEDTGNGTKK